MPNELQDLVGAYFHEDFGNRESALRDYLDHSTPDDLRSLVSDLDEFVASTPLSFVPTRLRRMGSYVWLGEDPQPYVDWLHDIRRAAIEQLAATSEG